MGEEHDGQGEEFLACGPLQMEEKKETPSCFTHPFAMGPKSKKRAASAAPVVNTVSCSSRDRHSLLSPASSEKEKGDTKIRQE